MAWLALPVGLIGGALVNRWAVFVVLLASCSALTGTATLLTYGLNIDFESELSLVVLAFMLVAAVLIPTTLGVGLGILGRRFSRPPQDRRRPAA